MKYCNKDIMDVMIEREEKKTEAKKEHSFGDYLKAEMSLSYFVLGLQMAGMSESKTLKLKKVAMKILTAKTKEVDVNGTEDSPF